MKKREYLVGSYKIYAIFFHGWVTQRRVEIAGLESSSVQFLTFRSCESSFIFDYVLTVYFVVFRTDSCRFTREARNEVNPRGPHSQSCAATPWPGSEH